MYGAKVKSLMTGLALDADELTRLREEPSALRALVEEWTQTPEWAVTLHDFFALSFQQSQLDPDGLLAMVGSQTNFPYGRLESGVKVIDVLERNVRESFARTAVAHVAAGRSFRELMTTRTFYMTTGLALFQAHLEHVIVNDRFRKEYLEAEDPLTFVFYRDEEDAPPLAEAFDPNSAQYLHLYHPNFDDWCLPDSQTTYEHSGRRDRNSVASVLAAMFGHRPRVVREVDGDRCVARGDSKVTAAVTRSDFEDWRPVTLIRVPLEEPPTAPLDLEGMRAVTELRVHSDRLGFFTTLGFLASWPTNEDNDARVTINQTLITALGKSFSGQTVSDFSPENLNEEHSAPGTACFGCHQTLDPMREFFRASFSVNAGRQTDRELVETLRPQFAFGSVRAEGDGVEALGQILGAHPDLPAAWAQKLCYYANAAPCPAGSEAFREVLAAFEASGWDFRELVASLMSSPLVTGHDCVAGGTGRERSIARRTQICARLSGRLGIEDVCAREVYARRATSKLQDAANSAVSSIPDDEYARGATAPMVIADTSLFTRASREALCREIGEEGLEPAFGQEPPDVLIPRLVAVVMGLSERDPRHDAAQSILEGHVTDAVAAGASERVALQSALALACMSPGLAGNGF